MRLATESGYVFFLAIAATCISPALVTGDKPARQYQQLLQEAADGNASAMEKLGTAYAKGTGVTQNYQKAIVWWHRAAAVGNWDAMIDLSLAYSDGQGVPQDYAKAMEWFRKGAAAGDGDAMVDIALLYQNGQGVPQDYAKAMEWLRKAEASGDPRVVALSKECIAKIKQAEAAKSNGQ